MQAQPGEIRRLKSRGGSWQLMGWKASTTREQKSSCPSVIPRAIVDLAQLNDQDLFRELATGMLALTNVTIDWWLLHAGGRWPLDEETFSRLLSPDHPQ